MNRDTAPDPTLLDAVDALTLPQTSANWQARHEHTWERCHGRHGLERCNTVDCDLYVCEWCDATTSTPERKPTGKRMKPRTDPPLLEQLRTAVASNVGGSGGGGKARRERTPIDVAAFATYEDIDGRCRALLTELGGKVGSGVTTEQALRAWYVLFQATNPTVADVERRRREIAGWEDRILDVLDPPKKIEILAPCPICGKQWVNIANKGITHPDPDDIEQVNALNAFERERLDDCYAMCVACETVWKGVTQMRHLRIAIDEAEAGRVTAR